MRIVFKSLLLLFMALFLTILSPYSANITSIEANAASDSVASSPAKYRIDVSLNSTDKTLTGTETVSFLNKYEDALSELNFHLYPDSFNSNSSKPTIGTSAAVDLSNAETGDINITQVLVGGKSADFTQDKQILKLHLQQPLQSGNAETISISFSVKIPAGTDRLGYKDDVYSITNWYPILCVYNQDTNKWDEREFNPIGESNYSEVADYTVTIKAPKNITIASTGTVTSSTVIGNERTSTLFSSKTRDFVFSMSSRYKSLSTTWNGIKVTSYYIGDKGTPDSEVTARHLLGVVTDSLKFYSECYGKYPYAELKLAETYLDGGAMEYPAFIQMGEYTGLTEDSMKTHSSWLEDAAAHETGHQWWYVAVGNDEFSESLMDEGLNTFSTAYYFDKRYGKSNPNAITLKIRNKLDEYPAKPMNSAVDTFASWSEYQRVIYDRGSELFTDLMTRLGEPKFLKVLHTYASRYWLQNGSVAGFAAVLEEVGGKEIKAYFLSAINNENYYPENIALTSQELQYFKNLDEISDLELREASLGISLSSLLLRALKGEQITFVLPSKATAAVQKAAAAYANKLKADFKHLYSVNLMIVKDTALLDKQKAANLIVLGTNESNMFLSQLKAQLPMKFSTKDVSFGKTKTTIKQMSAIYAFKNPKNTKSVLTVVYWKDNLYPFNILEDNYDQYILNYSDDHELRGQF